MTTKSSLGLERKFVVGIRVVSKVDGIFKDYHSVAKAVGGKVGEVKSIRIARSGFVVVECVSEKQMFGMFSIKKVNGHIVECFEFGGNKVGVISGVPLTTDLETFEDIHCVKTARRMKRFREGKMEPSQSVCLTFYGDLPERI